MTLDSPTPGSSPPDGATGSGLLPLAEGFPPVTREDWRALVDKSLKGVPFEKAMLTRTYDGVTIQPLYTRADAPPDPAAGPGYPGVMPFTRGGSAAGAVRHGWDVRTCPLHPDPAAVNRAILTDLERGAVSVTLRLDLATRCGLDADAPAAAALVGEDGMILTGLADLDRALDGVYLDGAVVNLEAGAAFEAAAALMIALWEGRGVAAGAALGAFNADPVGTLAAQGALPMSLPRALERLGALAAQTAATWPRVTAVRVDGAPWHDGGASDAQTLGAMLATAVAYLRAMERSGLDLGTAARQIVFSLPMDADIFAGIAKLRAARRLWARLLDACGVGEADRAMRLSAVTARRMLTRRDPWVNMLRGTAACFAAAVGGAEAITVAPFDAALGVSTDFARRIARNVHVILMEESALGKVIDPAGGSWYVEHLTDALARAAWGQFQAIEAEGGIAAALETGWLAQAIAGTWAARRSAIARRKDPITGVSEFPHLGEKPVAPEPIDRAALVAEARARAERVRPARIDPLADVTAASHLAARQGVGPGALVAGFSDGVAARVAPIVAHSLAEDFEALRDAADAHLARTGERPAVFLVTLGTLAQHTVRLTYSRNVFEAGGLACRDAGPLADAQAAVAAWRASGASVAVLCSSDGVYEAQAETVARALKAAGLTRLLLAGNPREARAGLEAAGVDGFIHLGCDLLAVLEDLHAHLGLVSPAEDGTIAAKGEAAAAAAPHSTPAEAPAEEGGSAR